jgi:hypothetical protein
VYGQVIANAASPEWRKKMAKVSAFEISWFNKNGDEFYIGTFRGSKEQAETRIPKIIETLSKDGVYEEGGRFSVAETTAEDKDLTPEQLHEVEVEIRKAFDQAELDEFVKR